MGGEQGMARIGVVGLGVMGGNLALNIADHGFDVAIWNRSPARIEALLGRAGPLAARMRAARSLEELVAALAPPRAVLLMIKAGAAVDETIAALGGLLAPGDIIIDGGNADFHDTRRRSAALAERGIRFLGMGISGGAEGARHGPSIMVGGAPEAWAAVRDIFEAIAARYEGDPCAALLGPDGAGHFVKTVHNGIEYADMQLIAEIYGLLRDGARWPAERIGALFARFNGGRLNSYLMEISAEVLKARDPVGGGAMVDAIVDSAGQKGTGRWTVIEALRLGEAPMVIAAAVAARVVSALRETRRAGAEAFGAAAPAPGAIPPEEKLEAALLAGRIIAYTQGFSLLNAASAHYGWGLDLARIAEIWRAGCIIRSAMLDDMAAAARAGLPHGLLAFAPLFAEALGAAAPALRETALAGLAAGLPLPAHLAALSWFDSMRQARGSADLIQAQRDFFGAHGFERLDGAGPAHGPWAEGQG